MKNYRLKRFDQTTITVIHDFSFNYIFGLKIILRLKSVSCSNFIKLLIVRKHHTAGDTGIGQCKI